jgi:hypothetical protein|tara:strand:- start:4469 stop:4870 length:402 start_codon:yes stop_codon:yes gene_type:complete|eukprot:COSAG01_NODE_358_length_18285_cov_111.744089_18_plen_134_part_00
MNSIIKDGYADVSNLLDTRNSWFNDSDEDNFFQNNNQSQPYIVSVPSNGVIGGLPIGGSASIGFGGDVYSNDGYKRNSKDVNRPYNVIPSGNITMKDVDFPVLGIDNLGNSKMMYPENDYRFQGNKVLELPLK